jgi:hypothetical protein
LCLRRRLPRRGPEGHRLRPTKLACPAIATSGCGAGAAGVEFLQREYYRRMDRVVVSAARPFWPAGLAGLFREISPQELSVCRAGGKRKVVRSGISEPSSQRAANLWSRSYAAKRTITLAMARSTNKLLSGGRIPTSHTRTSRYGRFMTAT